MLFGRIVSSDRRGCSACSGVSFSLRILPRKRVCRRNKILLMLCGGVFLLWVQNFAGLLRKRQNLWVLALIVFQASAVRIFSIYGETSTANFMDTSHGASANDEKFAANWRWWQKLSGEFQFHLMISFTISVFIFLSIYRKASNTLPFFLTLSSHHHDFIEKSIFPVQSWKYFSLVLLPTKNKIKCAASLDRKERERECAVSPAEWKQGINWFHFVCTMWKARKEHGENLFELPEEKKNLSNSKSNRWINKIQFVPY